MKELTKEQSAALHNLGDAIQRAIQEAPVNDVLSILTNSFLNLTVAVVKHRGIDVSQDICVDGGPTGRDITVHAPKSN